MTILTWPQVLAWRLRHHSLSDRAPLTDWLAVVQQLGGLHAQLMSAAELSLLARVDGLTPDIVPTALWEDRTLVKLWAMRGTLHLVATADYPLVVAVLSTLRHYRRGSWLNHHGITETELDLLLDTVPTVLAATGLTREALADHLAVRLGNPDLRERLLSGWGALLKPAAFLGRLCFSPSDGQRITFVRPDAWLGPWARMDTDIALAEAARRFLTTYGPATIDEFARWWGLELPAAKRVFRALDDVVQPVTVDGRAAFMLAAALPDLQALAAPTGVRLLPFFDPYVVAAFKHAEFLMPPDRRAAVYRPQGWISPVVLIDGAIAGVWTHDRQRQTLLITVDLFSPITPTQTAALESEAQRIAAYLDAPLSLTFTT